MSVNKTGLSKTHHLAHVVLFLIACFFISEPSFLPFTKFFKAFGEACLIALLVIYLVEVNSHKRLEETAADMIRKVGKNIFGVVYGHVLPNKLVDAIETTLERPIYRDRMKIDIELIPVALNRIDGNKEPACQYRHTYSYSLVNCSDSDVIQNVQINLERDKWLAEVIANNESQPIIEYVLIGSTLYAHDDALDSISRRLNRLPSLLNKSLADHIIGSVDGNQISFSAEGITIPADSKIDITFNGLLVKRNSDNEVWATSFPTLGVNVTATSNHYEIEARFPSDDLVPTNQSSLSYKWVYDSPMLSGQSVIFWWRPKKTVNSGILLTN